MSGVTWVRIGDLDPAMQGEQNHFVALDENDEDIGIVRRIDYGAEAGDWMWSMTCVHPGKPLDVPRSGMTETRGEAARALAECWEAFKAVLLDRGGGVSR